MAKKISEFGILIRRCLSELGMEQVELAKKTGLSKSTINKHVTGNIDTLPDASTYTSIATAFGLDADEVRLVVAGKMKAIDVKINPSKGLVGDATDIVLVHFLADVPQMIASVSAGDWTHIDDFSIDGWGSESQTRVTTTQQREQKLFRVKIYGDSMESKYPDGQTILFRVLDFSNATMGLRTGRDYYIQLRDGSATFKRLIKVEGSTYTLAAINKKKHPKLLTFKMSELARAAIVVMVGSPPEWDDD